MKPVEPETMGYLKMFAGLDEPAPSRRTRERYAWEATGTSLLDTLNQGIDLDFA